MSRTSIMERIQKEPRYKRVMYSILEMCCTPQRLSDLTEQVAALPDMRHATHGPTTVITWLVDECALKDTYLEDEANEAARAYAEISELSSAATVDVLPEDEGASNIGASEEQTANVECGCEDDLTENPEADMLAEEPLLDDFILMETTEEGRQALECYRSEDRLADLLENDAARKPAYFKALRACLEPRTQAYMEELLIDEPSTETPKKVYPAYVLDRLENAEAIAWNDGWLITPAGKTILESEELEGGTE